MKTKTIRSTLFLVYSSILVITFLLYSTYIVFNQIQTVRKQMLANIQQNTFSIANAVDGELEKMNLVTMNVAYSNMIKGRFALYSDYTVPQKALYNNTKVLGDMLTAIIGPNFPVQQVYLYSIGNGYFASGRENGYYAVDTKSLPWYDVVLAAQGSKIILKTGEDLHLSRYSNGVYDKNYLSLLRLYYDIFKNPQGIVETKKSLTEVFSSALAYKPIYGESVYIFDKNGSLLFPITTQDFSKFFIDVKQDSLLQNNKLLSVEGRFLSYITSDDSGFTTIISLPRSTLFYIILDYIKNTAIITAVMFVFSMAVSYISARYITNPIALIHQQVTSFRLEKQCSKINIHSRILELNALNDGFYHMQQQLVESVHRELMLQNQEMQLKMLALQSKMNPHFLYNSLATIQSMADEGMDNEIILMCQSISNLLRYISSDSEQLVPLETELHHTQDYLNCMTIRYDGDLTYKLDIPQEMLQIQIPKLCIQLLVENAIKFSSNINPPWQIIISGKLLEDQFFISVIDNGPGFDESTLQDIKNKMQQIDSNNVLPSLKIEGMGLMNIYIRLKMLYQKDFTFELENASPNGAILTIGGKL